MIARTVAVVLVITLAVLVYPQPPEHNYSSFTAISDYRPIELDSVGTLIYTLTGDPFAPYGPRNGFVGRLARTIYGTARWEGVDPVLIARLVRAESGLDTTAVSVIGALGLGQIIPEIWRGVFPTCGPNLLSVRDNICYTVKIWKLSIDKHRDLHEALSAYSGGCRYTGPCSWYVRKVLNLD